jgi:16S rRNA (cytosine1402-N4)-methyltransferase
MSGAGETHVSVLAPQVRDALVPALGGGPDADPAGVFVDATAGLGGHTRAILDVARPRRCVLFDRDRAALARARARLADAPCPIDFVAAPFSTIAEGLARLGIAEVAAIVADLGVSSMQLDDPARGFSFRADAPLDMRMDPTCGPTAAEAIEALDARALARILREYGEEPDAARIAAAIVAARPKTTGQLAESVVQAMSARQRRALGLRIHPATRTFMALRIHVNGELEEIDRFLDRAPPLLSVGGRLAVISFHSLEDRRVKRAMRELSRPPHVPPHLPVRDRDLPRPKFRIPKGYASGVVPDDAELSSNPRARSARLRVLERCLP